MTATFRTGNLDFASALVAATALNYVKAEAGTDHGRIDFLFDDPEGKGDRLAFLFTTGQFTPVQPRALFAAKMFCQDAIAKALNGNGGTRHAGR